MSFVKPPWKPPIYIQQAGFLNKKQPLKETAIEGTKSEDSKEVLSGCRA
jgi:hypothetical protein